MKRDPTLQAELDLLERTDPAVAAAKAKLDRAIAKILTSCPECHGRGWHVGECHPREECGACDGTGKRGASDQNQGGGDGVERASKKVAMGRFADLTSAQVRALSVLSVPFEERSTRGRGGPLNGTLLTLRRRGLASGPPWQITELGREVLVRAMATSSRRVPEPVDGAT